jgi:hypothetical protein
VKIEHSESDGAVNYVVTSEGGDVLAQGYAKGSGNSGTIAAIEDALTRDMADDVRTAVEESLRIARLKRLNP